MTAGYLGAVFVAVMFMMFLDGDIGVMMLAFLILMPILSLLLTLYVKRRIKITLVLPESASKHRALPLTLLLEKQTRLPIPFLRMRIAADAHFLPLNPEAHKLEDAPVQEDGLFGWLQYRKAYKIWKKSLLEQFTPYVLPICCSMSTERKKTLEFQLTGQFCGTGEVTLNQCELSDFLRMFRFSLQDIPYAKVMLLPSIPNLKPNGELFRTVSTEALAADDECESTPTYSANSTAGYEHRDYVAGDSLRRINWKLSSKRHRLMVRKDEPVSLAKLSMVLDFRRPLNPPEPETLFALEQLTAETALGLLSLCTQQGFPCVLYYTDETANWVSMSVDSPEQLAVEAVGLLRGGFRASAAFSATPSTPPALASETNAITLWFASHFNIEAAEAFAALPVASHYYVVPKREGAHEVHAGIAKSLPNLSLWQAGEDNTLAPIRN